MEGVTLEQLRTLRAVAEAGSFSAAARKLGRVQAAVSQSIERLEAQLGLRLFDRSGRVARLTRNGEEIVAAAARIDERVEALDDLAAALKTGKETKLSIVVDVMFPTASLVAFGHDFMGEHPSVELVLFTEVLSAVTAQVRQKAASFGVAIEDADLAGLDHRAIAKVRLLPVAARPLDPSETIQIVLGEHGVSSAKKGVLSQRTWRVVDLATKHALILGGLGWGNMPEHVVRDDLRKGRLVELAIPALSGPTMQRSLLLVTKRGAVMGPVARWAQKRLSELCLRTVEPHHTK
jgi:DNA-binding transcriptional LysR family regulator